MNAWFELPIYLSLKAKVQFNQASKLEIPSNQETDERWWNYQINPLNQRQENHLEGLRIRDLTFESSLK